MNVKISDRGASFLEWLAIWAVICLCVLTWFSRDAGTRPVPGAARASNASFVDSK